MASCLTSTNPGPTLEANLNSKHMGVNPTSHPSVPHCCPPSSRVAPPRVPVPNCALSSLEAFAPRPQQMRGMGGAGITPQMGHAPHVAVSSPGPFGPGPQQLRVMGVMGAGVTPQRGPVSRHSFSGLEPFGSTPQREVHLEDDGSGQHPLRESMPSLAPLYRLTPGPAPHGSCGVMAALGAGLPQQVLLRAVQVSQSSALASEAISRNQGLKKRAREIDRQGEMMNGLEDVTMLQNTWKIGKKSCLAPSSMQWEQLLKHWAQLRTQKH